MKIFNPDFRHCMFWIFATFGFQFRYFLYGSLNCKGSWPFIWVLHDTSSLRREGGASIFNVYKQRSEGERSHPNVNDTTLWLSSWWEKDVSKIKKTNLFRHVKKLHVFLDVSFLTCLKRHVILTQDWWCFKNKNCLIHSTYYKIISNYLYGVILGETSLKILFRTMNSLKKY